jgi:hypothetical protein
MHVVRNHNMFVLDLHITRPKANMCRKQCHIRKASWLMVASCVLPKGNGRNAAWQLNMVLFVHLVMESMWVKDMVYIIENSSLRDFTGFESWWNRLKTFVSTKPSNWYLQQRWSCSEPRPSPWQRRTQKSTAWRGMEVNMHQTSSNHMFDHNLLFTAVCW